MANTKIQSEQIEDDIALGGNPTTTTQSAGNNTTRVATTAFVTTAVANLVDSAPSALDTLNELAAAMGDDASFSTTITNSIATKLPLAGGTMSGALNMGSQNITSAGTITASGGSANNNDDANILTLNASQHARLLVDTSSTSGHRATLALESNGNETTLATTGSASFLSVDTGSLTVDVAGSIKLDADSGEIDLQDGGTDFGQFAKSSNDFRINHSIQDGRFVFRGNDGGSIISALTLDIANAGDATFNRAVTATEVRPSSNLVMNSADNQVIYLGAGNDFLISHDGSNNILNSANNHSLRVAFGGTNQWEFHSSSYMKGNDGKKVILGDSSDLQIYHDGSNSYIDNTQSGPELLIRDSNAIILRNYSASENMIHCAANGSVNLYYDGSTKLTTVSDGFEVHGGIYIGGTAAANKIDHFEQGSWTPSFSAGGLTVTQVNFNKFTRVGDQVFCQCYISIGGTANGANLTLSGLPFTVATNGFGVGTSDMEYQPVGTYIRAQSSTTQCIFLKAEGTSSGRSVLIGTQFNAGYGIFSFSYFTS